MSALADAINRKSKKHDSMNIKAGPVLLNMADVKPANVSWLWPSRIPLGRLSLLIGLPGEGKSFLTADIAARVSRGCDWPDGGISPLGDVILISAEDDAADTIRPRLDACGADSSRICLMKSYMQLGKKGRIEECPFTLADYDQLEAALESKPNCKLVIIDPIGSFVGGKVDIHRDNEVRAVLGPLAMLASKYGFAVIVVAHRRKASSNHADDLALGSRAFSGIARAAWHLTRDTKNKDRRLLLSGKNNLAKEPDGLAFRFAGIPARIEWESNSVSLSANDALAIENGIVGRKPGRDGRDRPAVTEAKSFLEDILAKMPLSADEVKAKAKLAGIPWRTIERAKEGIAESRKSGFESGWKWFLIGTEYIDEGCQLTQKETCGGLQRTSSCDKEKTINSDPETSLLCQSGGLRENLSENLAYESDTSEERQNDISFVCDREAKIAASLPPDAYPIAFDRNRINGV